MCTVAAEEPPANAQVRTSSPARPEQGMTKVMPWKAGSYEGITGEEYANPINSEVVHNVCMKYAVRRIRHEIYERRPYHHRSPHDDVDLSGQTG